MIIDFNELNIMEREKESLKISMFNIPHSFYFCQSPLGDILVPFWLGTRVKSFFFEEVKKIFAHTSM